MNILITGVHGYVKYNLFINNRLQVFYLNYKNKLNYIIYVTLN